MAFESARSVRETSTVWHVNSTATGGGVAELLQNTLIAHERSGLHAQWHVIDGDNDFFDVTKTLHHRLHGSQGNERALDAAARRTYEAVTAREAAKFAPGLRPGDIVVLHDPQTLGMAQHLADAGVSTVWRSHIGTGTGNDHVDQAWDFLRPYMPYVSHCVFSVADFAPDWLADSRTVIIPPSIDPETPKNVPLSPDEIAEILVSIGVSDGPSGPFLPAGKADRITNISKVIQDQPLPHRTPAVIQISRWDPLKDMAGVLQAFIDHVAADTDAHLVLAGPDPADIPDDPEGAEIFANIVATRAGLDEAVRTRIHLVVLSLGDTEANALAVNALQRRADVIVQHSLREGFGLTVTEAMWKRRPIVASRIDGIARQVEHGVHGLLTDDPTDLAELGTFIKTLLADPELAERLGEAAHERCEQEFLLSREIADYLTLYAALSN